MDKILEEITQLNAAYQAGQEVRTLLSLPQSTKQRGENVKKAVAAKVGVPVYYSTIVVLAIQRGLAEMEQEYINQINHNE